MKILIVITLEDLAKQKFVFQSGNKLRKNQGRRENINEHFVIFFSFGLIFCFLFLKKRFRTLVLREFTEEEGLA